MNIILFIHIIFSFRYTYEICLFDEVRQKLNDGRSVLLGYDNIL